MKEIMKIFLGVTLLGATAMLTLPNMAMESWGKALIEILKGGITMVTILIGITLTLMGFNELKE